jgi:osmotically inducible lipoprotein OsmB
MITLRNFSTFLATSALAVSLVGCGSTPSRDRSTTIGAGGALGDYGATWRHSTNTGAGAGALGGGTAATVGGAAVGGVIGNQMGKDNK